MYIKKYMNIIRLNFKESKYIYIYILTFDNKPEHIFGLGFGIGL